MHIVILATGKKRTEYDTMITEYTKRITRPFSLETVILNPSGSDNAMIAITQENTRVMEKLMPADYVIALDERGSALTTIQFAHHLEKLNNQAARQVVFVIGGAYGLNDAVRRRANLVLQLSSFVLPHELARLVLTEQLYRVTNLLAGGKYHHQ